MVESIYVLWKVARQTATDEWVARENPSEAVRTSVEAWCMTIDGGFDDPFVGSIRVPGDGDRWESRIPGTQVYAEFVADQASGEIGVVRLETGSSFG